MSYWQPIETDGGRVKFPRIWIGDQEGALAPVDRILSIKKRPDLGVVAFDIKVDGLGDPWPFDGLVRVEGVADIPDGIWRYQSPEFGRCLSALSGWSTIRAVRLTERLEV